MTNSMFGWKRFIIFFAAVAVVFGLTQPLFCVHAYASTDTFAQMRQRWCGLLTGGENDTEDAFVKEMITERDNSARYQWQRLRQNTASDRLFPDQDIQNSTAAMTSTYMILRDLAIAYRTQGGALYLNAELKADLIAAMDFMYRTCYHENTDRFRPNLQSGTNNWWDWEIGSAQKVNDITILLYDALSAEQRANYMNAVAYFVPDPTKYYYNTGLSTGANRVSAVLVAALHGIITEDSSRIAAARAALSDVLLYVEDNAQSRDGFYEDGSFIQHGSIAYTGGYGLGLISDISDILYLLADSPWEVTDSNAEHVHLWMYHAFEPFVNSGMMMDAVSGRQITRSYNKGNTAVTLMKTAVMLSLAADGEMAQDFRSMAKTWAMNETAERQRKEWNIRPTLFIWNKLSELMQDASISVWETKTEYRQYARMDRAIYRNPAYAFAISMSSERISRYEALYGENADGWHTGDGMTYLYNADESAYADAFWPTVDRYRLPGTTVAANVQHTEEEGNGAVTGESQVGGVQLANRFGVSCMRMDASDGVKANKSWFMLGDEIVALGSDITAGAGVTVETIAENRKVSGIGQLTVDGVAKATETDWTETGEVHWAHLAGETQGADIGYYFPDGGRLNLKRESKEGQWAANKPVHAVYQTMWFTHDLTQGQNTYAYMLLPNRSAAETAAYTAEPKAEILVNTAEAQAVRQTENGLTAAVFWKDARTRAAGITSSGKAALIMQETGDETVVSVSDPTQKGSKLEFELAQEGAETLFADDRITVTQLSPTIKFTVDCAGLKGASVSVAFSKPSYQTKTLLKLDQAITFLANGGEGVLSERGTAQLNLWASDSRMSASGITAGGFDSVQCSQKKMSWYKDHIQFNQTAVTPKHPMVIQMRFRVSVADAVGAEETASSLRLRIRGTNGGTEVEVPVAYCDDAIWRTAVFVIDPIAHTLSARADGDTKSTTLPSTLGTYKNIQLYLVSTPKPPLSQAVQDRDGTLPLDTEVKWEIDSLSMREDLRTLAPVIEQTRVWRAEDGALCYEVQGENRGLETPDLSCIAALKDESGDLLLSGAVHPLGMLPFDAPFHCTGRFENPFAQSRNARLEVYLWGTETQRPFDFEKKAVTNARQ